MAQEIDTRLARAYRVFSEVLDLCAHSERVALRLSTCRNAFLTINAAYVDLRFVIGENTNGSRLKHAIHLVRTGKLPKARSRINEVLEYLSYATEKLQVWEDRVALDLELKNVLEARPLDEREYVKLVLSEVRTPGRDSPGGEFESTWPRDYLAVSTEESSWAAERRLVVSDACQRLCSCARVLAAICGVDQGDLFATDEPTGFSFWDRVPVEFREEVQACFAAALEDNVVPSKVLDRAWEVAEDVHATLFSAFAPNLAMAPLPPPYVINLIPPVSNRERSRVTRPAVRRLESSRPPPGKVRVGLPTWAPPDEWYDLNTFRLRDQYSQRARAASLALAEAGNAQDCTVVAFPEYSLPKGCIEPLTQLTGRSGMAIVGGVEGSIVDGSVCNELLFSMPDFEPQYQRKIRRAVDEPGIVEGQELLMYGGSVLGNCCALVCSDWREQDVVSTVAEQRLLMDFIVICSRNHNPEQFKILAKADSVRFFCHVVIVNALSHTSSLATSDGSGVTLPASLPDEMEYKPRIVPISGFDDIAQDGFGLLVYEVDCQRLVRGRGQRARKGIQPAPMWCSTTVR